MSGNWCFDRPGKKQAAWQALQLHMTICDIYRSFGTHHIDGE